MTAAQREERRFRRLPVAPGAMELRAPGAAATVIDFAPEGVSVAAPAWPAGPGAPVELHTPEARIPCRARAVRRLATAAGPLVGLQLEADAAGRRSLVDAYHRLRFPALSRRGEIPGPVVHDLFDRSGYTALKSDVQPSAEWLAARWPATLTREAVYTAADGTVLGHIGVTRAYRRAWLGHEIATRRDHPEARACRRALYHHFATWPRLLDGDDTMLLGYYNRSRPWHQALFERFAAGVDGERDCRVLPLDRFTLTEGQAAPASDAVSPARTEEHARVAALIVAQWPRLFVQALDLEADRLASGGLHPEYAAAGLERARVVLALRRAGSLVGAALCETSSGHLSLFNVLNGAQLFFDEQAGVSRVEQQALVQAVRAFFAARGLSAPLVVATPGQVSAAPESGLRLIETMGAIVWTARGLRRYEEYIDTTLADYPLGTRGPAPSGDHEPKGRRH
jgi:hypothetical protein